MVRQMSQVYVTGLACGASDVTGLCHRFGMWCVRCHRFMSRVWHVVRQMSQGYVTGVACGASDVTGLCHRFGMWCVRCHRFMSRVWHVVRQMSQGYVTGVACGASDVTGLCHRFGMWCVRCHRFMSQVWHVVRQMSQVYVTGFACVRQKSCHVMYTALHCEKPVSRSGTLLNGWCKFHKSRYNSRHHFIMACGVFSGQIIFFM